MLVTAPMRFILFLPLFVGSIAFAQTNAHKLLADNVPVEDLNIATEAGIASILGGKSLAKMRISVKDHALLLLEANFWTVDSFYNLEIEKQMGRLYRSAIEIMTKDCKAVAILANTSDLTSAIPSQIEFQPASQCARADH